MSDHKAGEGEEVEGPERGGKSFVVSGEATKTRRPSEASLYHPAAWQQDKAAFGLGMFNNFQLDAVSGSRFFRRLACVTLIHVSQFDIFLRDLLHLPGQFADLGAILLIGWRDVQSQQMAQRIHSRMYFRSFAPFGSVIACSRSRFRRRLQGTAVQDHRRRLFFAPRELPQQRARR